MDKEFRGFEESKKSFSSLPNQFFSELLPLIDDINELKLTIYLLWSAYTQGDYGVCFRIKDILLDEKFMSGLDGKAEAREEILRLNLKNAAWRGSIIEVERTGKAGKKKEEAVYFINSPRGRQAAALYKEESGIDQDTGPRPTLDIVKPNIFALYEENIGPLTPIIADALREAQAAYPEDRIKEAIQLAVKNNVRRWKYVESILVRWQEEGKDGADRRDDQEDHRRYIKGEYGEIGQH